MPALLDHWEDTSAEKVARHQRCLGSKPRVARGTSATLGLRRQ